MANTAAAVLVHVPVQLCQPPSFCISGMLVEFGLGEGVGDGEGAAVVVPGADITVFDKLPLPHPQAIMEMNKATLKATANLSSYILEETPFPSGASVPQIVRHPE